MANRTLGALRAEIITRLGFGAAGSAAGVIISNINSFLFSAQVALYNIHDWVYLREYYDKTIGVGQFRIDYPTELNPERIYAVFANINGIFRPVEAGITPSDYTYQDNQSWPQKYERYSQIEIFPKADAIYTIRIWGIKTLGRFTQDNDLSTVDSDLVFLHALVNAKAHYRQPDSEILRGQLESFLSSIKSKSWSQTVFAAGGQSSDVLVRPKVV